MPEIASVIARLQAGNRRFVEHTQKSGGGMLPADLVDGQSPSAIILGCSDSRVPAEIVFDQGLGDLFVIRVAGNIVAPTQIGSVEFAATQFASPLVVVLGHSKCGAVAATVEQLTQAGKPPSRNIRSIVERVEPSVLALLERGPWDDPDKLMRAAVRANVRASVQKLKSGSSILEELIEQGKLAIVGAEYLLETGVVEFFDVPPELRAALAS